MLCIQSFILEEFFLICVLFFDQFCMICDMFFRKLLFIICGSVIKSCKQFKEVVIFFFIVYLMMLYIIIIVSFILFFFVIFFVFRLIVLKCLSEVFCFLVIQFVLLYSGVCLLIVFWMQGLFFCSFENWLLVNFFVGRWWKWLSL